MSTPDGPERDERDAVQERRIAELEAQVAVAAERGQALLGHIDALMETDGYREQHGEQYIETVDGLRSALSDLPAAAREMGEKAREYDRIKRELLWEIADMLRREEDRRGRAISYRDVGKRIWEFRGRIGAFLERKST